MSNTFRHKKKAKCLKLGGCVDCPRYAFCELLWETPSWFRRMLNRLFRTREKRALRMGKDLPARKKNVKMEWF